MAIGKRTSSEIKSKIIEAKINDPDLSCRDIAENVDTDYSTVSRILKNDLQQVATQSQCIANLIDTNNNLQTLADARIKEALENKEESIKVSDLVTIRESAFKQNRLLTNESTENIKIDPIKSILEEIGNERPE